MYMTDTISKLFRGRKLVIATKHRKERVIAPLLEDFLGVETIVPRDFDTDQFGTFTGEIKRAGSQLEAARAKALAAMSNEGVDLGVSSEGVFGPHPSFPFVQSNLELVLLIDRKNGYEICGHHRTQETNMSARHVKSTKEALDFAQKIGFPEHGIIVRARENDCSEIYKDIRSEEALIGKVGEMLSRPTQKLIFLETDMRAHANPTRMMAIAKATEDLIKNMASLCPRCQTPGYIMVDFEKGLKCSICKLPTDLPLNDIYQCSVCNHREKRVVTIYGDSADAKYCQYCNP